MVRQGGLRRFPDRLDLSGGSPGEERLGVDGERNLALRGGVVTTRDLQRSLDALGLYHYLEARGAAVNPNRDPYHLPTCLLFRTATPTSVRAAFASTTRQCKPSLLQPHNRCINNRRQSFQRLRGQSGQSSPVRARVGQLCRLLYGITPLRSKNGALISRPPPPTSPTSRQTRTYCCASPPSPRPSRARGRTATTGCYYRGSRSGARGRPAVALRQYILRTSLSWVFRYGKEPG